MVVLEHKGLYWSKVKGTDDARTVDPSEDYIVPLGKARIALEAVKSSKNIAVITYGMGVSGQKRRPKNLEILLKSLISAASILWMRKLFLHLFENAIAA